MFGYRQSAITATAIALFVFNSMQAVVAQPNIALPAPKKQPGSIIPPADAASQKRTLTAREKEAALGKYCLPTEIRPLPGGLNDIPCFNSNSPEMVLKDGILLSTFPSEGMSHPNAHLNYSFDGRFDLFSHHVTRSDSDEDDRTLYIAYVMRNAGNRKVHIKVLTGASYLSRPDAPFLNLPDFTLNDTSDTFAGPGDRITDDVLRNKTPSFIPKHFSIAPGEDKLFLVLPLPVRLLRPALNGRSTLIKLKSDGPVYIASVAKFFHRDAELSSRDDREWLPLLSGGNLCEPRDETPTPPGASGKIKYGRVSGVSRGTKWVAEITDAESKAPPSPGKYLEIPEEGKSYTYPISTVQGGTLGTKQVQSAPMIVRYPDTAYEAHGNYAVTYEVKIPLYNPGPEPMDVEVLFQTALKSDEHKEQTCFYDSPPPRAFYRGTVFVSDGKSERYWHMVQKQGAEGAKVAELTLNPEGKRSIRIQFLYPPDATPPQEICIRTVRKTESSSD